ncbi:MAG: hypothetical protein AMK73_07230 [Planctomycetes bacterium SM23_32]|nr:MAG: hypothetical protein AMK73_07230 [Planctomycetes bacterium SM23_32]
MAAFVRHMLGGLRLAGLLALQFALLLSIRQASVGFSLWALIVVTVVFAGCWVLLGCWDRPAPAGPAALAAGLPLTLLTLGLLVFTESVYFTAGPYRAPDRALPALAFAVLAAGWLTRRRRTARLLLAVGCATFALFLVTQVRRSPTPVIDVWSVTTEAARALLAGRNPYALTYSDIYERFGWKGFGYERVFVYLPGMLLHYAPAVAVGLDVRCANLLAQAGGLAVFAWFVRRAWAGDRSWAGALCGAAATGIFWFHKGQVHLLEMAWAEGLLLFYLCLALWAWRRSEWLTAVALVLFLSLKQTAWFCAPFLAALAVKERRWRLMAGVAAGVGVVVSPFFLWNPGAFFHNVAELLMQMKPREDSLGWGAVCLRYAPGLSSWVAALSYVVLGGAWVALIVRLRRRSEQDALLETQKWMLLGLFGFFLFLKVSFFNYYYLVAGLLAFHLCVGATIARAADAPAAAGGQTHDMPGAAREA